jgi:hypothetical protein
MVDHSGHVELDALRSLSVDSNLAHRRRRCAWYAACSSGFSPEQTKGILMKKIAAVSFVSCFLLLSACATHNAAVVTPVSLTVASKTANKSFVSDVRDATLKAIRQQVPSARPLTVAVNLDVTYDNTQTPFYISTTANKQRVLPPENTTQAVQAGAVATVPVNESAFFTQTRETVSTVRLAYTISDPAGHVIESQRLKLDSGLSNVSPHVTGLPVGFRGGDPFVVRRELIKGAADFLASRVKTLSQ